MDPMLDTWLTYHEKRTYFVGFYPLSVLDWILPYAFFISKLCAESKANKYEQFKICFLNIWILHEDAGDLKQSLS